MASIRLRAGAVYHGLKSTSHTLSAGESIPSHTDLCVVGKISTHNFIQRHHEWLQQLRNFNGRIVLDFTDDHLTFQSIMTPFYQDCLYLADCATCSSVKLKNTLEKFLHKNVNVIHDAIEVPILTPKSQNNYPLRMLWFGHSSNMPALIDFIPNIKYDKPVELLALTNHDGIVMLKNNPITVNTRIKLLAGIWSTHGMLKAAGESDLCIIPTDLKNHRKAGASNNRLLTALSLGLPTAADKIDSYLEFENYFSDIRGPAFSELLSTPQLHNNQILKLQKEIISQYKLETIGQRWIEFFEKIDRE